MTMDTHLIISYDAQITDTVVLFNDVISDGEINVLKRIATPKLRRARVRGGTTEGNPSRDRIAKSVFLPKNEHPVLKQLFARAHQMTNLDMEASESLQIANYGIGGHYVAHYDHVLLSQPEAGGATVFVDNNLTVFPTINGEGDMRTRHGACPVLAGDKWVANFWIHERGQEFIRHCATEENSDESYIGEL